MNAPLYQGAAPEISRVLHAQLPTSNPMQQTWDRNTARATENAYALEDAIIDSIEYTREQELEYQQQQLNADLKNELEQKLALSNGTPGSLFNKDGLPNKAAIKNFAAPYNAKISGWNKGFITPHSQQQALLAKQQALQGFDKTIRATITASLKPRAVAAFKQNYDLAIARGKQEDAKNAALELHARGFCSDAEYALYCLEADEKGTDYEIDNLADYQSAAAIWNNPERMNSMTARQRNRLESVLDHFSSIPSTPGIIPRPGKAGSTNPRDYEKVAPMPPAGLPYYMQDAYVEAGGDFSDKNPNAKRKVAQLAYRFALDSVNPDAPYNAEDEAVFRANCSVFKINESTVSNMLKEVRSGIADKSAPLIEDALKNIPEDVLYKRMPSDWVDYCINNELAQDKDAAIKLFFESYHPQDYEKYKASGLSLSQWYEANVKARQSLISSDYSAWVGDGKNLANDFEIKENKINETLNKYLGKNTGFAARVSLEPYINQIRQADLDRKARVEKHKAQQLETITITAARDVANKMTAQREPTFQPLDYTSPGISSIPYSSEPVIFIPKGYKELGEEGDVLLADPKSGSPLSVRIMESDKVQQPTLSSRLYQCFRLHKRNGSPLSIVKQNGMLFLANTPESNQTQTQSEHDIPEDAPVPTYGEVSQNNQLLPEWAENAIVDDSAEHAMPISDLPV